MRAAYEVFFCFGLPTLALLGYHLIWGKCEATVYRIGLFNTVTFALWYIVIASAIVFQAGLLQAIALAYLVTVPPLMSLGFSYALIRNRRNYENYGYAFATSLLQAIFTVIGFALAALVFFGFR
jgi:hypothetical protein